MLAMHRPIGPRWSSLQRLSQRLLSPLFWIASSILIISISVLFTEGTDKGGLPRIPGVLSYSTAPAMPVISADAARRIALQDCGLQGSGWGICIQTTPVRQASMVIGAPHYVLFHDRGCELHVLCAGSAIGPLPAWIVAMRAGTQPALRGAYVVIDARSGRTVELFGTFQRPGSCGVDAFTILATIRLQMLCALTPGYQLVIGGRIIG